MSEIAVKLEDISKFYKLYNSPKDRLKEALHPFGKKLHREFYALRNINLEVKKGEILGIVGRNGSGKSTLLKLISMVIQPSAGRIVVNGTVSAMLELGSGLHPDFTGMQNIFFNGTMMGFSRKEMEKRVEGIVDFADIGDFIDQPLKTYSSGMKTRLGFALAVSIDPDILIVDEVLAVGDELFKRKCYTKIEELFNSGSTVFYVSHAVESINNICSRVIFLERGELILDGPPTLVTRYYRNFLYSTPGDQDKIREEIIQLNKDEEKKKNFARQIDSGEMGPGPDEEFPRHIAIEESNPRPKAFFMPDFIPKTTVTQKFYDVDIYEPRIETPAGKEVNALVLNEKYIFSYKVKFNLDIENIRFSTLVQNEKGLSVTGFVFPEVDKREFLKVKKGETYLIKNEFHCILLPDNYYFSISVLHLDEKKEKVPLSRINDAAVFKIQEEQKSNYWGIVHLHQVGEITKLT